MCVVVCLRMAFDVRVVVMIVLIVCALPTSCLSVCELTIVCGARCCIPRCCWVHSLEFRGLVCTFDLFISLYVCCGSELALLDHFQCWPSFASILLAQLLPHRSPGSSE